MSRRDRRTDLRKREEKKPAFSVNQKRDFQGGDNSSHILTDIKKETPAEKFLQKRAKSSPATTNNLAAGEKKGTRQ